jgi:hypothetical protein
MFNKINNTLTKTAVMMAEVKSNPVALLKRAQRGDADSGGSTLRTLGVVTLIVVVVGLIGAAILGAANVVSGAISTSSFNW